MFPAIRFYFKMSACTYCGCQGHWRPDCPEIAWLQLRSRLILKLVSQPIAARKRKLKVRWRAEQEQEIKAFYSDELEKRNMREARVNKAKLLEILKKNRDEHRDLFLEAQKNFRVVAIAMLDAQLKAARDGKPFELTRLTTLLAPQDHTADYERSIQMLEMSVNAEIMIDEREFQHYVQDVWNWSREWAVSNLSYVDHKSRSYSKMSAMAHSDELCSGCLELEP